MSEESLPSHVKGPIVPASARCGLTTELSQLWALASQSQEPAAYELGHRLHQIHRGNAGLCVRLYWLLKLCPALDAQRRPCDWLYQAMGQESSAAPVLELYRRELLAEPREGLSARCADLLSRTTESGPLLKLANWRWQAASAFGEWQIIPKDLESLRGRWESHEDGTWPRLLLEAIAYLAWGRRELTRECLEKCLEEVRGLIPPGGPLDHETEQLELLEELSKDWEKLDGDAGLVGALSRLIPHCWTRPFEEARPALRKFLAEVCRDAQEALRSFDNVHRQAGSVLVQFGRLLDRLASDARVEGRPTSEGLRRLVNEFLYDQSWQDYWGLRTQLLHFCLGEGLSPEEIAPFVEGEAAFQVAEMHLSEYLAQDRALRAVCWAHRLFWA